MKILALEKEIPNIAPKQFAPYLKLPEGEHFRSFSYEGRLTALSPVSLGIFNPTIIRTRYTEFGHKTSNYPHY